MYILMGFYLFSTYALQPSRLIVRSGLDVPTFATRHLHPAAEGGTGGKKFREFFQNADFHVTFRDLLHAVKLRQTDGFTSPPKEGVLRIFSP
jgi:hypothetical protein